jgi:hypothetical protein
MKKLFEDFYNKFPDHIINLSYSNEIIGNASDLRELIRKYETFIEKYQKTPAVPYGNDLNMGHSDEAKGVINNVSSFLENFDIPTQSDFIKLIGIHDFITFVEDIVNNRELPAADSLTKFKESLTCFSTDPDVGKVNNVGYIEENIIGISDLLNKDREAGDFSKTREKRLYGKHSLLIDDDVSLPGKNMVFYAPSWLIKRQKIISLKGKDCETVHNPSKASEYGAPGYPGESGLSRNYSEVESRVYLG